MLQQNGDHLAIEWTPGETSKYHWLWLRDSCQCPECLNSHCKQKYFDPAVLPLDIRPRDVAASDEEVRITWPDGHVSRFASAWLRRHDYSHVHAALGGRGRHAWRPWTETNVESDGTFPYAAVIEDNDTLARALKYLFEFGFVMITPGEGDAPDYDTLCGRLAGFVDRSYFGDFFDLEVKPENATDSVSFSTKQLPLHTDIPYYMTPPDYQFLFGLHVNTDCRKNGSGRTRFVDGLAAALTLKERDPAAFEVLTRTEVTYRAEYPWANKTYVNKTTIIHEDENGNIVRFLNNPSKMFFEGISFEDMMPLYEAYSKFKQCLHGSNCSYSHGWSQGDMIIFDNRRIFHGREDFSDPTVTRTLRGGYFREVELYARFNFVSG